MHLRSKNFPHSTPWVLGKSHWYCCFGNNYISKPVSACFVLKTLQHSCSHFLSDISQFYWRAFKTRVTLVLNYYWMRCALSLMLKMKRALLPPFAANLKSANGAKATLFLWMIWTGGSDCSQHHLLTQPYTCILVKVVWSDPWRYMSSRFQYASDVWSRYEADDEGLPFT